MTLLPGMRGALRRAGIAGVSVAMFCALALAASLAPAPEFIGPEREFVSSASGLDGIAEDKERADAEEALPASRAVAPPSAGVLRRAAVGQAGAARFVTMVRSRGPPAHAIVVTEPRESGSWGIHPYPQNG